MSGIYSVHLHALFHLILAATYGVGIVVIAIGQIRNLRLREAKELPEGDMVEISQPET